MSLLFTKQISAIHFGIMSPDEIQKASVVEVKSAKISSDNMDNTVYDSRMGSMDMNTICPTCNCTSQKCPGHFGHLNLAIPIIHPLHFKFVLSLLRVFCCKCSRFIMTKELIKLHGLQRYTRNIRFKKILKLVEKNKICSHCLAIQPKITFSPVETEYLMCHKENKSEKIVLSSEEISKRFENVLDEEVELLGFDPKKIHPRNLIIWTLPILPPIDRPYVIAEGMTCDDDLTIQYIEIIKINCHLKNPNTAQNKRQKYNQSIKFRVKCLFDNSQNKAKHTNGRPFKGYKKRIAGKEGQVRGNLMGKRVEQAGRTVIGPDPRLKFGQLAIPKYVAETLTIMENVNSHNITDLQDYLNKGRCNVVLRGKSRINLKYATRKKGTKLEIGDIIKRSNGEILELMQPYFDLKKRDCIFRNDKKIKTILPSKKYFELQIGDKVERQLKNGDFVLLNRQPTLHKGSMIAHEIVIKPGKTFRFTLASTSSFNADFDGDEMNIHVPGDYRARAEMKELSSAKKLLVSAQSSKCNVKIVQDSLVGNFLMTRDKNIIIPKHRFWNICMYSSNWNTDYILKKCRHIDRVFKKYGIYHGPYTGHGLFSMLPS